MSNVEAKVNSGYFNVACKGARDAFAAQRGRRKISANEIFIQAQIDSYGAVEGFRSFFTEKLSCGLATVSRVTSKLVAAGKITVERLPNGKTEYRSASAEEPAPFYRVYNFFLTHVFEFNFKEKKDERGNVVKPARSFSRRLTSSEVLVLSLIFTHSSNGKRKSACFWSSNAKIADMLALSERQVERAIINLMASRLIFRHVRGQNRVRSSKFVANVKDIRALCTQYAPKKEAPQATEKPVPAYIADVDARASRDKFYAELKREAENKAEAYKRDFLAKAPSYATIERELRALCLPLAKAELYNLPTLEELQAKERALKAQAAELLQEYDVDARLFDAKAWARCHECGDTGTLPNGCTCDCWKGKLN